MPDEIEHPDVSREETDASFRAILFLLIGAAVVAVVIYVGITLFFFGWRNHETAVKKSSFPLAPNTSADSNTLSPLPAGEPRLEQVERLAGSDKMNVKERLTANEAYLNSSGHTDDKKFDHISIERAMKMLEDKLPARAEPPADAWRAEGLIDSGESNSGREFRGKKR